MDMAVGSPKDASMFSAIFLLMPSKGVSSAEDALDSDLGELEETGARLAACGGVDATGPDGPSDASSKYCAHSMGTEAGSKTHWARKIAT